jgi:hypothetical protein
MLGRRNNQKRQGIYAISTTKFFVKCPDPDMNP